jgi:hypothetical protein
MAATFEDLDQIVSANKWNLGADKKVCLVHGVAFCFAVLLPVLG